MKKNIKIAVDYVKVVSEDVEIDFPEVPKYYIFDSDSFDFKLFGIIPKYPNSTSTYLLVRVGHNTQELTDFMTKDCLSEHWGSKHNELRRLALNILMGREYEWKEISESDFMTKRHLQINAFLSHA